MAASAAASAAHVIVPVCPTYPASHFTEHVLSACVLSTMPAVQPSVSPLTTPVPNVYAAQLFSATNTRGRAETAGRQAETISERSAV